MSSNSVVQAEDRHVEFTPFGGGDKIKLSAAIVRKFVASKTRSGQEASDVDCMKFIMLCKARGLNPFEGDAFLQGYDSKDGPKFTLITAHQALLKRAEANPNFDGMESGVVVNTEDGVKEYEGDMVFDGHILIGGWSRVYRRDRSKPSYRRLALKAFNTNQSRWEKDPAGMIVKCAEADALRSSFPLSVGGLYTQEEQAVVDVTPPAEKPQAKRGQRATVVVPAAPELEALKVTPSAHREEKTTDATNLEKLETMLAVSGFSFDDLKETCALNVTLASEVDSWGSTEDINETEAGFILENLDVKDGEMKWKRGEK